MIKRLLRFSALAAPLIICAGLWASSPVATGFLEGRLKISLSRGVELADDNSPKPEPPPYAEYPLAILSKDGRNEVAQVVADKDGHYRVALPPGDYILEVKGGGRRRLRATPHPFKIVSAQTAHVDMDIDPDNRVMAPDSNSR